MNDNNKLVNKEIKEITDSKSKPGRPKGAKNKKNAQVALLALDRAGFDVMAEIIHEYSRLEVPQDKITVLLKLLPWLYPQLAQIEMESLLKLVKAEENPLPTSPSPILLAIKNSQK